MNLTKNILTGLIFSAFWLNASASEQSDLKAKVAQINQQTVKLLGVSLNALRYLVAASPKSYLLLSSLEESGDIKLLRELERKGYIKIQTTQGLPDGTNRSDKFARVIPLDSGIALQECVVALQSGNSIK